MLKYLKNIKIGTLLLSAFLVISLCAVGIGILGTLSQTRTMDNYRLMYNEKVIPIQKLAEVAQLYQKTRVSTRDIMLMDKVQAKAEKENLDSLDAQIDALILELEGILSAREQLYQISVIKESLANLRPFRQNAIALLSKGTISDAYAALQSQQTQTLVAKVQTNIDKLTQTLVDAANTQYNDDYVRSQESIRLNMIIAAAAFSLSLVVGVLLSRSIRRNVNESVIQLMKMAQGESTERLDEKSFSGEFRVMARSMNAIDEATTRLYKDTVSLANTAMAGELSARIDSQKHLGAYRQIVEGVNGILDCVIAPINEARDVLTEISQGNLGVQVTGDYQGDHAVIKDAVNTTVDALNRYIGEISGVLGEMSKGNLDVAITSDYKGDFTKLKDSLNGIVTALNVMMNEINSSAEQVSAGMLQVSAGGQQISQGATEQASSIEELTASIAQVAGQTKQNALAADRANKLANTAMANALKGNEEMQNMLDAMQQINEAAASIYKIIKVIDDIAFRTNILALNAAVEAARVGVHGKGFTVVASEVRNLAAKSAKAAQETGELIAVATMRAEAGTEIASKTALALNEIVNHVDKTANIIHDIAISSGEQATGIAQINTGIAQMSQVVQSNSATAEQSASAGEELAEQANILKEMVSRFKLRSAHTPDMMQVNHTEKRLNKNAQPAVADRVEKKKAKVQIVLDSGEYGKY